MKQLPVVQNKHRSAKKNVGVELFQAVSNASFFPGNLLAKIPIETIGNLGVLIAKSAECQSFKCTHLVQCITS